MSEYSYKVDGEEVTLEQDPELLAVRFKEPAQHSQRSAAARSAGVGNFERRLEVPHEKYTLFDVRANQTRTGAARAGSAQPAAGTMLAEHAAVERVAPVFKYGSSRVIATERVLIGLRPGVDPKMIASAVGGVVIDSDGDEHVIQLPPSADPLAAAKLLDARDEVEYAEPDFVNVVPKLARKSQTRGPVRLDAFDRQQYALRLTQAEQAWELIRPNPAVRIAILDEGVDSAHEDLATSIVGCYDAADNDLYQEPNPWDGHGTACAGLAAAIHNRVGVRGVAGGCSLLAVRIAYTRAPDGPWVITNSGIARAIDWCWRSGAAVLSNSWGGGAPSTRVTRAFERARTKGRNGKGCVIVVAAGNEASKVSYPANLPNVVCVAASNEYDEPKTTTSHDGENWWGSNFGPQVTLAAPGVHNYTTDITGIAGYNQGPLEPNYIPDFNGTSSATPIVAGAAAMVLSANPELTEAQVRQILIDTADKVGSVTYDRRGHHPRMGFGRVNVKSAVRRALPSC